MANDAWLLMFGTNAVAIQFGEMSVQPGLGVHQLSIPISARPTSDAAHDRSFAFDGQAYVNGLNGGGGYLGRFAKTKPQMLRPNGQLQSSLLLDLSVVQVNEIESRRSTGFSLNINIDVYADSGEFGSTQLSDYQVSREKWLQILEHIDFRKTLLLELAVPETSTSPEMVKATDYFADAQRRFLEGENRQAIECLRQTLAAIVGVDPAKEDNETEITSDIKSSRQSEAHYADRVELIRRALKFMTDIGAHPSVDETRPREVRAAITMTAGLLQWYLVKP
jgi:hypothetical protein